MNIRTLSILLVFFMSCPFLPTCRNRENVELLKSYLNSAINESNEFETARLLDSLLNLGVDPKTLPVEEAAGSACGELDRAETPWRQARKPYGLWGTRHRKGKRANLCT